VEQSPDRLISIGCDLLTEVNQKRLIARVWNRQLSVIRVAILGEYIARGILLQRRNVQRAHRSQAPGRVPMVGIMLTV